MKKYEGKIIAKINVYKWVEVKAKDKKEAEKKFLDASYKLIDDSKKVLHKQDKDLEDFMSTFDYSCIREVED